MSAYKHKLYVVTWGDAWSSSTEFYRNNGDHAPLAVTNVGWLCESNDETIVLCSSFSEGGTRRGLMIIPHVNVIKIEELT